MKEILRKAWHQLPLYLACYAIWAVLSIVGLWITIRLPLIIDIIASPILNHWVLSAIDRFGIFLFGLIWLGCVVGLEGYLRHSLEKGLLWQRSLRFFLLEVAIVLVFFALQWLFGSPMPGR
ncbi:MAG: hypothetical protein J7M34_05825 [Anaerolineae bacterium]|nr:hypothetical protein [Anaerolineae bacterium]